MYMSAVTLGGQKRESGSLKLHLEEDMNTLHGTGRPGSWDPHWNPLLEQCVSHLSILIDRFSKTLTHSMGRSIPLHILCIQTHQLLSITEYRGKKRK